MSDLLGFILCSCSTAGAGCDVIHVDKTIYFLYKEKNFVKAEDHIEACAAQGDAASQIALAIVYLDGSANTFEDKSLDLVSAYMWYLLAFRRSKPEFSYHVFIVIALDQLKSRHLTPAEIDEAVRLADRWEKQHPQAAKSWPSDDYVENLNGASKALIPSPQPGPVKERFCDKFGEVITICPQWNYKNGDKISVFRKKFYSAE